MLFIQWNLRLKTLQMLSKWDNDLDLRLEFDEDGRFYTRIYDKRDDLFSYGQLCL